MEKLKIDKQWTLKLWDWLKGVYMAVVVPLLVTILEVVQAGSFNLDWESIAKIAVSSLAAYLLKNLVSPTKVVIEQPTAQTVQAAVVASAKDPDNPGQPPHPVNNPIHPRKDTKP